MRQRTDPDLARRYAWSRGGEIKAIKANDRRDVFPHERPCSRRKQGVLMSTAEWLPIASRPSSDRREPFMRLGCGDRSLIASDLMSSAAYARDCKGWHAQATAHREARTVRVGANAILVFEDRLTVRHQLQEMIRVERISERAAVQAEIDRYTVLIPDGRNLKASLMLEFADAAERRAIGPSLVGIERTVWLRVEGRVRIFGRVTSGLDTPGSPPPLTHWLAFELGLQDMRSLRHDARLSVGIDHRRYSARLVMHDELRRLLLDDLH